MGYNMTDEEIKKCDSVEKLTKLGVPLNSALVINGVSKDLYQQYISKLPTHAKKRWDGL